MLEMINFVFHISAFMENFPYGYRIETLLTMAVLRMSQIYE